MEARTRVRRARAACKMCICVQQRTCENVLSESVPPAFPCLSYLETNAWPRPADSEVRFHRADVTLALVQCHTSQNATKMCTVSRLRAVAHLEHDLILDRPAAGLTHDRFTRSRVEAGAACLSFVSFEGPSSLVGTCQRRTTASSDCRVGS